MAFAHAVITSKKAPKYSLEQWEAQKPNIERLYIAECKPITEIIRFLARDFNFIASEKQLKSRLPKWGLDIKNLKGDTMIQSARTRAKRKQFENKDTDFEVNKKVVPKTSIDRYLKRHNITKEELLAMASPVDARSPAFNISTPHTIDSSSFTLDIDAHSRDSRTDKNRLQGSSEELDANRSNYRSPTVEDVPDEDLGPSFCFRRAQVGREVLLPVLEQHPSSFGTPAPYNIESRTPSPYAYSLGQSSRQTSLKSGNPERQFIMVVCPTRH